MAAGRRRRLAGRPRPALAAVGHRRTVLTFDLHRFDSLPSTQIEAARLAGGGAPEWTVVVAREQTAGRGRLGNSFHSPAGGLYCSIVLRPWLPVDQAGLVGLAAGLATAEAVREITGATPTLKWPNDLLLAGRKLSGQLVEVAAEAYAVDHLILGIGLNVNIVDFPPELATIATSLQLELGRLVDQQAILDALLRRLSDRYAESQASPSSLLAAWRAWPNLLGQPVRVAGPEQPWQGLAEDLDAEGALLVRTPEGGLRRVIAADVHLMM